MRLVCICDNGETLDVMAAVNKRPYDVRALLHDAIFYCHTVLSDTLQLFHAEHALRAALASFEGSQDRYAKSYIVSRTLDSRVQKTQRAELIQSSYRIGGPLALIGVFYATFDAHRNSHARETLDNLSNRSTEESRHDLFKRANTFPCNDSVNDWYRRIVDKYGQGSQDLACVLYCLGNESIPNSLITRCRIPSETWDSNGEITRIVPRVYSVVGDELSWNGHLRSLETIGLVKSTPNMLRLNQRLCKCIYKESQATKWKIEAATMVFHAFPKYQSIQITE